MLMSDGVQKKITKTQARYLARASQKNNVAPLGISSEELSSEVLSVAPLLEPETITTSEQLPTHEKSEVVEPTQTEEPVHIIETSAPTPVPIRKGSHPKRSRKLIEGEKVSYFIESIKRERIELIDALCTAGFNHNRFALGNDGYAEEVRHEVHTAITIGEWSVASILERKEYGFRSWKDIAEEVAQVSVIQKDVLTDTLFDAIVRAVTLYPSAGTREMMRRSLVHTLIMREVPADASEGLKDFLSEVVRVYFAIPKGRHFSPFENALITAVYAYYGETPPNTVSHEMVHSGGWTGLKKTLLRGGGASSAEQQAHAPKSETYPLPDITTLPKSLH